MHFANPILWHFPLWLRAQLCIFYFCGVCLLSRFAWIGVCLVWKCLLQLMAFQIFYQIRKEFSLTVSYEVEPCQDKSIIMGLFKLLLLNHKPLLHTNPGKKGRWWSPLFPPLTDFHSQTKGVPEVRQAGRRHNGPAFRSQRGDDAAYSGM